MLLGGHCCWQLRRGVAFWRRSRASKPSTEWHSRSSHESSIRSNSWGTTQDSTSALKEMQTAREFATVLTKLLENPVVVITILLFPKIMDPEIGTTKLSDFGFRLYVPTLLGVSIRTPIRIICVLFIRTLYKHRTAIYTRSIRSLYVRTLCAFDTRYKRPLDALCTHSIRALYEPYTHSIRAICALDMHSIRTRYALFT